MADQLLRFQIWRKEEEEKDKRPGEQIWEDKFFRAFGGRGISLELQQPRRKMDEKENRNVLRMADIYVCALLVFEKYPPSSGVLAWQLLLIAGLDSLDLKPTLGLGFVDHGLKSTSRF